MPDILIMLIMTIVLALAALLWLGALLLLGRMSGWKNLAVLYPDQFFQPAKARVRWVYARLGPVHYNATVVLEAASTGLRIRTLWGFHFGHMALFVPWSELQMPGEIKKGAKFFPNVPFGLKKSGRTIFFTPKMASWVIKSRQAFEVRLGY